MQTKEQERAAFALKQITNIFGIPVAKDDANFVVGVPTMILTNGLGQTMAFLLAKGKSRRDILCISRLLQRRRAKNMPSRRARGLLQRFRKLQTS